MVGEKVLVYGANGQQGRTVTLTLLKADYRARALVRDADKAKSIRFSQEALNQTVVTD